MSNGGLIRISQLFLLIQSGTRFSYLKTFKESFEMDLFTSICETLNIPPEASSEWMGNIMRQYSEANRHFHNVQMLEKKLLLIGEFASEEPFKNALVLATLFQYYDYDVKRDLKKENCDQFRLFIDQAGIKDVSSYFFG